MRSDARTQWQVEQGEACACGGSDDYCPCQNVQKGVDDRPAVHGGYRSTYQPLPIAQIRNAYGLALYLEEIVNGSTASLVVVQRGALKAALKLVKDHRQYSSAKRSATVSERQEHGG